MRNDMERPDVEQRLNANIFRRASAAPLAAPLALAVAAG
jgi:hypothetical protein